MAHWLLKTEPGAYSFVDLEREGMTTWNGVTNALALQHLRRFRNGDQVLIYHTGNEKRIVGVAAVSSDPYPDPAAGNPNYVVVDLTPVRRLPVPVTLAAVRNAPGMSDVPLLRISRLSVMPVSPAEWKIILSLSR